MGASIISGCDASPVLKLGEQVLDLVALSIENLVVVEGNFAAAARGDAGLDTSCFEFLTEPCAVIAAIGNQMGGRRQGVEHETRALVVAHLAF